MNSTKQLSDSEFNAVEASALALHRYSAELQRLLAEDRARHHRVLEAAWGSAVSGRVEIDPETREMRVTDDVD